MAATVTSGSKASATGATSVSITPPSGTAVGDLLVAFVWGSVGASTTTIATPSGWTQVLQRNDALASNFQTFGAWWKVATSSDASGTAVKFSTTGSGYRVGGMVRITGADTSAPINVSTSNATTASTSEWSSVTPTVANTVVLLAGVLSSNTAATSAQWSRTPPSGTTLSVFNADDTNTEYFGLAYVAQVGAAATGVYSAGRPDAVYPFQTITLAVKPLATGGAPPSSQSFAFGF